MSVYEKIKAKIKADPKTWLITGVSGFIGSNLLEELLRLGQRVVGLDNFSTGSRRNISEVMGSVSLDHGAKFHLISGDIRRIEDCLRACRDVDYVLHQAAIGSVLRSIEDPISTNQNNIDGFLNMLLAARDTGVKRFIYAASSSSYGDHPHLPKREDQVGKPLSPYAVTKLVNELYAEVFARTYGLSAIGLRYFNVFGPRQDPIGAYAAVIPRWIDALLKNEEVYINGDGETSRDFCYVANVIQANLLAACSGDINGAEVFNVAVGEQTTLNQLFSTLIGELTRYGINSCVKPSYRDFRAGDVRHSFADIRKAQKLLGYVPTHGIHDGIRLVVPWYIRSRS